MADGPKRFTCRINDDPTLLDRTADIPVVVVVCILHINRSGLNHTQSYMWLLPIRYVVTKRYNGSHHGDNPLLGPTGIQIATKSYATLQAMAPTNNKTVHQTSFTPYREQPRSTRIVVAYPRPAFSATNRTNTFQPVLINNIPSFSRPHIVQK